MPPTSPASTPFAWDPAVYASFSDERLRPALDLIARLPRNDPRVIYDLGCGPGNVTRLLARHFPSARVVGLDSSAEMLQRARTEARESGQGEIEWVQGDIARFELPAGVDLVFSNAALHWLDDQARLFERLARSLAGGGVLAAQMPMSWWQPSHRLMRETLETAAPDGAPLGPKQLRTSLARPNVADPLDYWRWLHPFGRVDLWSTEYVHLLRGEDAVLRWVSGTALRPVLEALEAAGAERRELFLERYRERLRAAYPSEPDGTTLFPFRRLFVVLARDPSKELPT